MVTAFVDRSKGITDIPDRQEKGKQKPVPDLFLVNTRGLRELRSPWKMPWRQASIQMVYKESPLAARTT